MGVRKPYQVAALIIYKFPLNTIIIGLLIIYQIRIIVRATYNGNIPIPALIIEHLFTSLNGRVIDHGHNGHRHIGAHHIRIGHAQEKHKGHKVAGGKAS